jgi:hypothetical protein
MKNIYIILLFIIILAINACCKPSANDDQSKVSSFVVGVDQKAGNVSTAVQWIDGKEIFLSDTNNSIATFAFKAIYKDANYFAFGGKTIPAVYAGGPGGQLPLMWKNGVETALPYTYAASAFKDAAFVGTDLYVLTAEMDNTWIPSTAIGHVMLYKNGVAIMDKPLQYGYSNAAFLRISNSHVYVATNTVRAGFGTSLCYQDGIEIFATSANANWYVAGVEVIGDDVTVFANQYSPNYYCAAFPLGQGEIKITDSKSVINSFEKDNQACAIVRETGSYNKDVDIWKNKIITPLIVPTNSTYPNVSRLTKPITKYSKEYYVGTISNDVTNESQCNVYENNTLKNTLPKVRSISAYDAVFY